MQGKLPYNAQSNLFKIELSDIVSDKIDLVLLTKKIDWNEVEIYYGPFYSLQVRQSVPKRTMIGLLL
jgi:IS5 family transposase